MHKYKTLFGYEFRRMWWALILGGLMALVGVLYLGMQVSMRVSNCVPDFSASITYGITYGSTYITGSLFSDSLVETINVGLYLAVVVFPVLTAVMFRDGHSCRREEYFRSLPFTQSSRFAMRMGVGYMIITAVSVLFGVGTLLVRQANIDNVYMGNLLSPYYKQLLGNETIWHMLRSLLVFWLCLLVIYTVCVMAHTIVANGVLAGLVSIGILLAPKVLLWGVASIGVKIPSYAKWKDMAESVMGGMLLDSSHIRIMDTHTQSMAEVYYLRYYSLWMTVGVLLAAGVVSYLLARHFYCRKDMAKQTFLVPGRGIRIVLAAGMGACFGLLIMTLISYYMMIQYMDQAVVIQAVLWGGSSIVCCLVSYGILRIRVAD